MLEGDKWVQAIDKIEESIGPIGDFSTKKALKKALDNAAMLHILDIKQDQKNHEGDVTTGGMV